MPRIMIVRYFMLLSCILTTPIGIHALDIHVRIESASTIIDGQRLTTIQFAQADGTCETDLLAVPGNRKVWLFSLTSTFPGSASQFHHWVLHYLKYGFQKENMVLVLHKQGSAEAIAEFEACSSVCTKYGIECQVWEEEYSSEARLKLLLNILNARLTSPHDWVAHMDLDEFSDYGGTFQNIQEVVDDLEAQGANFLIGRLVDKVAKGAKLRLVVDNPSIWEQFPLQCDLRSSSLLLALSQERKIVLVKGYLRTNKGNHNPVNATYAETYFGPSEFGQRGARYGFYGEEDLRDITPYRKYAGCYDNGEGRLDELGRPYFKIPTRANHEATVYHFKWHAGVIQSARQRLMYYQGNVTSGGRGMPRFEHWKESQKILDWATLGLVPLKESQCYNDSSVIQKWSQDVRRSS